MTILIGGERLASGGSHSGAAASYIEGVGRSLRCMPAIDGVHNMTDQLLEQLTDWQEADHAATLAETAVAEALRLELEGGPPVDPAVLHELARLRALADEKLTASMNVLAERARKFEEGKIAPLQ